jgi:hypothetical protein
VFNREAGMESKSSKQVIFSGRHGAMVAHHPDDSYDDTLDEKWGNGPVEQCHLRYSLPKRERAVLSAANAWHRSSAPSRRDPAADAPKEAGEAPASPRR